MKISSGQSCRSVHRNRAGFADVEVHRAVAEERKPTIEYELLSSKPYAYTLADLKLATHVKHKRIAPAEVKAHGKQLREAFFAKP